MIGKSKQHIASVNETYWHHQRVAFRYGAQCLLAAIAAFMHGIVPGIFCTSASDRVKKLAEKGR